MAKQSVLFKTLEVNFDMADIAEFVAALGKEWPTITFVESEYSRHWIDYEAQRVRYAEGIDWLNDPPPYILRQRENWSLTLYDRPDDPKIRHYWAWVLPSETWEPVWGLTERPLRPGLPIVKNQPQLTFGFDRGCYRSSRVKRTADAPPVIQDGAEWIDFKGGRIFGSYERDDKEQLDFLKKVLRIAKGMTSNKHVSVDRDTGEIKQVVEKGGWHWSGRHLRAWAMAHPRHFIRENLKPLPDKIDEGMPWTETSSSG